MTLYEYASILLPTDCGGTVRAAMNALGTYSPSSTPSQLAEILFERGIITSVERARIDRNGFLFS